MARGHITSLDVLGQDFLYSTLKSIIEFLESNVARIPSYIPHWRARNGMHSRGRFSVEDTIASNLCLFLMLVKRLPGLPVELARPADRLAAQLAPLVRNEHIRDEIAAQPAMAPMFFGLGHVYLAAAGYPDPDWDPVVHGPMRDGFGATKDRAPHRILARLWAAEVAGLGRDEARARQALALSLVNSRAHPLHMSQYDAYSYTHCLMFATDFGRRGLDDTVNTATVRDVLRAALAWTLVEPDFDLLAEFLLCETFLDPPWSDRATVAWSTICGAWDRLGFVPGPTFDKAAFQQLRGGRRAAYAFKELYHTNQVVGIVCCALLARMTGANAASRDRLEHGQSPARVRQAPAAEADPALTRASAHCRQLRGIPADQTAAWELALGPANSAGAMRQTLIEGAVIHALRVLNIPEAIAAIRDLLDHVEDSSRTLEETRDYLAFYERLGQVPSGISGELRSLLSL